MVRLLAIICSGRRFNTNNGGHAWIHATLFAISVIHIEIIKGKLSFVFALPVVLPFNDEMLINGDVRLK